MDFLASNLFFRIFDFFISAIDFFVIYYIFLSIFKYKYKNIYKIYTAIIFAIMIFIVYVVPTNSNGDTISSNGVIKNIPLFILLITVIVSFYGKFYKKLIWCCISIFILMIPEMILMLLFFLLFGILPTEFAEHYILYYICAAISCSSSLFIAKIISIRRRDSIVIPKYCISEVCFLLVINISFIFLIIPIFNNESLLYNNSDIFISIIMLFLFAISISSVIIMYKLSKKAQEELERQSIIQNIEMENEFNKDLASAISTFRNLRHDINNHISIMKGLLTMQQYEDLKEYLNQICEELEAGNNFIFTKNKILSILLNNKLLKAQNLNIDFDPFISVDELKINDKDIISLIGNIIDNAIEATQKVSDNRYIDFSIKTISNGYAIRCKNPYTVEPIIKNNSFITTKTDSSLHGIGTKVIKNIVDKYNGTLDIFCENGEFILNIFLPIHD